jgi:hypothetical protein
MYLGAAGSEDILRSHFLLNFLMRAYLHDNLSARYILAVS